MLSHDEKRKFIRMEVDCELTFKLADSDQIYLAHCTSPGDAAVDVEH